MEMLGESNIDDPLDRDDSESENQDQENFNVDDYLNSNKEGSDAGDRRQLGDGGGVEDDLAMLMGQSSSKRQRKNAKAVECLDLSGKVIGQYRSGIEAVKALNIQQGDISLCCRGLKDSINGYRFRFVGDDEKALKGKRPGFPDGYDNDDRLVTRTAARQRLDPANDRSAENKLTSILPPKEVKASIFC